MKTKQDTCSMQRELNYNSFDDHALRRFLDSPKAEQTQIFEEFKNRHSSNVKNQSRFVQEFDFFMEMIKLCV